MTIPQLRPYQQDLKNQTYRAIQAGHKSILNILATGGGKTIIFGDIARDFVKQGKRVWTLTHREEIRLQTVEKLYTFGLQPGQIASGRPMSANQIQVASVQTLTNYLDELSYVESLNPDLIIVDECHHAVAPTWLKILKYFPKCINLGYTATPQRMDGLGLNNIYETMIEGPQTAELVNDGYLSEPLVFSSPLALIAKNQKYSIKNNEFNLAEQTAFMGQTKIVRETIDCYNQYFSGAPSIIFCTSVADCETVNRAMNAEGWKCGVVKSGMDSDLRKDYISGLGTGKYNALCSYEVIGEGVDIPVLAGVILRRLTRSVANYLQWCGRPLRLADGKKRALIVDQAGNLYLHGHPLEHRNWSLDGKIIRKTENEIKTRECPNPQCRAFLTGKLVECPYCGYDLTQKKSNEAKELRIVNAELLEIQKPEYNPPPVRTKPDLLGDIVANTFEDMKAKENTVESRFDFLMNNLGKSKLNKVWSEKK